MADIRPGFCKFKERQGDGSFARWDQPNWNGRRWTGEPENRQLTVHGPDELKANLLWAYREWMKVAALEVEWTSDPTRASLLYTIGRIDGRNGTLAWNEVPFGPDRQMEGKVDGQEQWHTNPTTAPARGAIHLGAVLCHEGGHGLGLMHDSDSRVTALLDPTYNSEILVPQPADIEQIQFRYGPPITSRTPDSGDPPEALASFDLTETLTPGSYAIVKL